MCALVSVWDGKKKSVEFWEGEEDTLAKPTQIIDSLKCTPPQYKYTSEAFNHFHRRGEKQKMSPCIIF